MIPSGAQRTANLIARLAERERERALDKPCIYDDIDKGIVISPLQIARFPSSRHGENKQSEDNLGRLMYRVFVVAYTAHTPFVHLEKRLMISHPLRLVFLLKITHEFKAGFQFRCRVIAPRIRIYDTGIRSSGEIIIR